MDKYIVYKTTNIVNNKIYIGVHKTFNPDKFDGYIGCGVYSTQPYTYNNAKTHFQYAVKKYGPENFKRSTLAVFETEEEAYALEEQLVNEDFLNRDDVYNMVLGGYGGYYISNRVKVFQYDTNGNYITEYDSMAIAADSLNLASYTSISTAVLLKCKARNFFFSTTKVDKLDLTDYNLGDNHAVKIYIYNLDGTFYKEFQTQTKCSTELKCSIETIRNSYQNGIAIQKKYFASTVKSDTYDKARIIYVKTRPVYKYDSSTGDFLEEYNSQQEAELKNPNSNISKAIKTNSSDENGFRWMLVKLENVNSSRKNKAKPVGKFDLQGNLVHEYKSATEASKENGTSVWKVLSGINKTHKGHIYKYI